MANNEWVEPPAGEGGLYLSRILGWPRGPDDESPLQTLLPGVCVGEGLREGGWSQDHCRHRFFDHCTAHVTHTVREICACATARRVCRALCDWISREMWDHLFQPVAELLGLPLDQARYVLLMFINVPLAMCYRHFLHPSHTPILWRHLVSTALGLSFCLVCFNWDVLFLIGIVSTSYAMLHIFTPQVVQRYTMIWVMGLLSICHMYRTITDYGGYTLDFSGPMMILAQKLTLVAFAVHDGRGGNPKPLNKDQEHQQLTSIPSLLEYFSYTFNFHSVLIGPGYTMREHLDFMHGTNLKPLENPNQFARAKEHSKAPSPLFPVVQKVFLSLLVMALYLSLSNYPLHLVLDPSYNVPQRLLLIMVVAMRIKLGFYFIWVLTDAINNAAGLGFSGYDESGNAQWDLTSCVNIVQFELAMNPRAVANNWNIVTTRWLRRVCYDRITWQRSHMTFLLSAFWHGFYPSYYLGLIYLGFIVVAAKKMWRLCNPFFTSHGWPLRWSYHLATWFLTSTFSNYGSLALQLMWPHNVYVYWKSLYFVPLLSSIVVAVFFPSGQPKGKSPDTVAKGNGKHKSMKQD